MSSKVCPRCRLTNPASAAACDCGFSFVTDNESLSKLPSSSRAAAQQADSGSDFMTGLSVIVSIVVTSIVYTLVTRLGLWIFLIWAFTRQLDRDPGLIEYVFAGLAASSICGFMLTLEQAALKYIRS